MIEVKNLSKSYGSKLAVDGISFTAGESEILGFLGPNGAGKSTTMNMLTGYLSSSGGQALINGVDILEDPVRAKRDIGYLPELPPLYLDMTVMEYLNFVYDLKKCKLPRKSHLNEICSLVKITDVSRRVIRNLSKFADEYKALPTLAFTHFQPAQPTTVGKRATLWLQELLMDLEDVEYQLSKAKLLGSKGTTGTQASFLELFDGDHEKCKMLDHKIAEKMGYKACFPVSGQTYSRKLDSQFLNVLAGIAQSAAKFSNDIRLLQHLKEVEEPFEKNQIGSSAMAYKRNPMRSERIGSLSRYVMVDVLNGYFTTATQWFERTLDDSANKRLSVPEAFLAVDGILSLYANVADGLVVYPKVIEQRLRKELPFMATENIMMDAVKKRGADRQQLHEKIREHSMAASRVVKVEGGENDLLERIAADEAFGVTLEELEKILKPENYTGRAKEQTEDFLNECIKPVLEKYADVESDKPEINV